MNQSISSGSVGQSADLRTRIAVALFAELDSDRQDWSGHIDTDALADAVISELGLRQEWGALDETDSGCIYDSAEEVRTLPRETVKSRYVTEWEDE